LNRLAEDRFVVGNSSRNSVDVNNITLDDSIGSLSLFKGNEHGVFSSPSFLSDVNAQQILIAFLKRLDDLACDIDATAFMTIRIVRKIVKSLGAGRGGHDRKSI
jgi:hypothetical protein